MTLLSKLLQREPSPHFTEVSDEECTVRHTAKSAQPWGEVSAAAITLGSGVTRSLVPKEPRLFIFGWAMPYCSIKQLLANWIPTFLLLVFNLAESTKQCSILKERKILFVSRLNNLSESLKPKPFLFFQYLRQEPQNSEDADYSQLSHDQQSQLLSKDDPNGMVCSKTGHTTPYVSWRSTRRLHCCP